MRWYWYQYSEQIHTLIYSFSNCSFATIVPLQQETPVPMKKSQKDLENEREKSRIIHEFIAKTNLPLYSSNPSRLISTTRNEKVRSWFMETTSEKPHYYNHNTLAPRTTAGTCRQPPLTVTKVSDNISRSRSDQLNYNLPFKPKSSTSYQLNDRKQRYKFGLTGLITPGYPFIIVS